MKKGKFSIFAGSFIFFGGASIFRSGLVFSGLFRWKLVFFCWCTFPWRPWMFFWWVNFFYVALSIHVCNFGVLVKNFNQLFHQCTIVIMLESFFCCIQKCLMKIIKLSSLNFKKTVYKIKTINLIHLNTFITGSKQ